MKADPTTTRPLDFVSDTNVQRYRNQATGIGQTRRAAEQTGGCRSQCVIDCAPPEQLKVKDRSYPAPGPKMVDGVLCDAITGLPWKPALGGANPSVAQPGTYRR
jgi:hypothetical protein